MTMDIKESSDLDFASEIQRAYYAKPAWAARFLLISMVVLTSLSLLWASWASLDEVTVGQGKIIPSNQIQKVQHMEGGILNELVAHEGQVVEAGEVLMRLSQANQAASLGETQAKYYKFLAEIARLKAEVEGLPSPEYPERLVNEQPAVAASETSVFLTRQAQLASALDTFKSQIEQKRVQVGELEHQIEQSSRSFELARKEFDMTRPMVSKGIISQVDLLKIERQMNEVAGQRDAAKLALPRARAAITENESQMEQKIRDFRSEAAKELAAKQSELAGVGKSLEADVDRVTRTEIRSPVRGTVNRVLLNTIGGVVSPGMDLIEIVPLDDSLLVEAKVTPQDIAFLRPGLDATVKLSAYDFSVYGGLKARLEHISADTLTDEKTGDSHYVIRVRTDANSLVKAGKAYPIIPGMIATVDIKTGEKTVLEYLLKPLIKARDNAMRER